MKENDLVYLKPNFVLEPLVASWYAWAQLISPVTSAMYMSNRNIPIMSSYLMMPKAHAEAVKNPKMLGGPFIDYNGQCLEEIKDLLEKTKSETSLLGFAASIKELEALLKQEANGDSMEELYKKIPEKLRGYVELVYDLNDQPSIRFFEALLYHSEFYREDLQTVQMYLVDNDDRPFVFSTPRIRQEGKIMLTLPFKSKAIDALYRMLTVPGSYSGLKNSLNISAEDEAVFESFFTHEKPDAYEKYNKEGIRTRYFGHACILIETKNSSILVDPVISYEYEAEIERLTYKDLPDEIDYVLITHNHQDHILIETILQLRHKVKQFIVPKSDGRSLQNGNLKAMLNQIGFKNVVEIDNLEQIDIPDGKIHGIPFMGEHGDLDISCKSGYLVQLNNYKVMFLADSNNIETRLYEHLYKLYGGIDMLFIGMECEGAPMSWLYGPLRHQALEYKKDQKRRLNGSNYEKAMSIIHTLQCKNVFVYAMGAEPWIKYISSIKYTDESYAIVESNKLIEECGKLGITAERLFGTKELFVATHQLN